MSEPIHEILSAQFAPGLGLHVRELEIMDEPILSNYEVKDFPAADRLLQDSNFRRIEEWSPDGYDSYVANVEFVGNGEPTAEDGIEAARLIDLAAVDGTAPGAMRSQQPTVEAHQGKFDHGAELE